MENFSILALNWAPLFSLARFCCCCGCDCYRCCVVSTAAVGMFCQHCVCVFRSASFADPEGRKRKRCKEGEHRARADDDDCCSAAAEL